MYQAVLLVNILDRLSVITVSVSPGSYPTQEDGDLPFPPPKYSSENTHCFIKRYLPRTYLSLKLNLKNASSVSQASVRSLRGAADTFSQASVSVSTKPEATDQHTVICGYCFFVGCWALKVCMYVSACVPLHISHTVQYTCLTVRMRIYAVVWLLLWLRGNLLFVPTVCMYSM